MNKLLCTLTMMLLLVLNVHAQSVDDLLKPVTRTYALKNVTIVQAPGQMIENGTIIIKDGLIHAVGKDVSVPAGAEVLKADSMYVYAGFIDAMSHIGIPAPTNTNNNQGGRRGGGRPQGVNPGNPPNDLAGITPEMEAGAKLSMKDKEIASFRKLGFTTVHLVPRGGMLAGKGALVVLAGEDEKDMMLMENVSSFAQLKTARGVAPGTVMGVMSKHRELFIQAKQLMAHHKAYKGNKTGMVRPESEPVLEALFPVLEGKEPLFFLAPNVRDIHRVMALQKDLGYNLVLAGVKQGWHHADQIKANNIPLILSMDLPKEIKEKKEDKEKEGKVDPEVEALEKKKKETYDKYVGQAAAMAKAEISFGMATMGTKSGEVRKNIQRMIKAGLSEDQALAALTTTPAQMMGVDNVMGTLEKGKIANLVVSDASYFAEKSNVRFVIADGHVFRYDAPKKKAKAAAGDAAKKAKIDGNWSFNIEIPGQETSGTMELSDGEEVKGTIKTTQTPEADIQDAELRGNVLTFVNTVDVQGQSVTLEFELTFDGNSFEGTVSVGEFGSFDISGTKNPN